MHSGSSFIMRRAAVCLGAVLMATGLGGCSLLTPTLDDAAASAPTVRQKVDDSALVQAGTLTVALDASHAPQAMTAADGTLEGYDIDIAAALAERLGLKLAVVSATRPDGVFEGGDADIFIGADADDESSDVSLTGTYLENATALFAGHDAAQSVTVDDLASASIGVQDGSSSLETVNRLVPDAAVSLYNNVNECVDALAAGEVDYIACDATAGAYLMRAHRDCAFMGVLSAPTAYTVACAADAAELGDAIQAAFDELAADGVLEAIHTMWYGSLPLALDDQVVEGVDVTAATDEPLLSDEEGDTPDPEAGEEGGVASAGGMSTWDDEA